MRRWSGRVWLVVLLLLVIGCPRARAGGGGGGTIGIVFLGMADGTIYSSLDDGSSWRRLPQRPDSSGVAAMAIGHGLVYAGTQRALYRSADGGNTWTLVHRASVAVIALDPVDPRVIYTASEHGTFARTADGGATWAERVLPGEEPSPYELVVDPARPATLLVLQEQSQLVPTERLDVLLSFDRGRHWGTVAGLPFATSEPAPVRDLAYDPTNPRVAYAVTVEGIYRSTDAGRHWHPDGLPLPDLGDLGLDPAHPQRLATVDFDGHAYYSLDGGRHWLLARTRTFGTGSMVAGVAHPTTLLAVINNSQQPVAVTNDDGVDWHEVSTPNDTDSQIGCLASGYL